MNQIGNKTSSRYINNLQIFMNPWTRNSTSGLSSKSISFLKIHMVTQIKGPSKNREILSARSWNIKRFKSLSKNAKIFWYLLLLFRKNRKEYMEKIVLKLEKSSELLLISTLLRMTQKMLKWTSKRRLKYSMI